MFNKIQNLLQKKWFFNCVFGFTFTFLSTILLYLFIFGESSPCSVKSVIKNHQVQTYVTPKDDTDSALNDLFKQSITFNIPLSEKDFYKEINQMILMTKGAEPKSIYTINSINSNPVFVIITLIS